MRTAKVIALSYTYLFLILLSMTLFSMLLPHIFGQAAPTTTVTPNTGNLKFQEQKAFIVIPPDQLPATVYTPAATQTAVSNDDIMKFLAGMAGGSITGLWARFKAITEKKQMKEKTENIEQVQREHSTQIIKGAEVDDKLADQVYENMGKDEAAKINDKPAIKKVALEQNKVEAVETAAKVGK